MIISKYVTLQEAIKSQTATRLGIDNHPSDAEITSMKHVAKNVFDRVRDHIDKPLGVSSFFRCEALNKAIGGSNTSQHCKGEAIDIDCDIYGYSTNLEVFNFIKDHLQFDQLIAEYPIKGQPSWVHVSLKKKGNRGEVLVVTKEKGYFKYKSIEDLK
jgi:zinc D-Ala-D-Ala carboxypeptidase